LPGPQTPPPHLGGGGGGGGGGMCHYHHEGSCERYEEVDKREGTTAPSRLPPMSCPIASCNYTGPRCDKSGKMLGVGGGACIISKQHY
jgi:hypothetical protein